MTHIADIVSKAANTTPITLEAMMAAIDKLNERPSIFPEGHPFHGVFEVKECAALKGSQVVIIKGDTMHYWPDAFEANEVKILRLPPLPDTKPLINFSWEFRPTSNLEF
jgi:hypothetical protein